jgi:[ribosomal protein S5]-alanine N-acetyltransferase
MDRDEQFMADLGGIRDAAGTQHYLAANLAHWAQHGFGLWILRQRETRAVIGRAVVRHLCLGGGPEVEIGYGFLPAFWGKGLGSEIARACVQIGLERLGLTSVVAITAPSNTRSVRVLRQVGLHYERKLVHAGLPMLLFRTTTSRTPSPYHHST